MSHDRSPDPAAAGPGNRLGREKSPYLLQHAANPVDWLPWGEEAFRLAREGERPVFLSIGYATCHWCHVMERESFADPETARLLNEAFVCVKVDREERPDVDSVYMGACQMLTGSGGWPLTLLLTPDRNPFFAATYIPRDSSPGRVGLVELVARVKDHWAGRRHELEEWGEKVAAALRTAEEGEEAKLCPEALVRAFHQLEKSHDADYGGFGAAPKFPVAHNLGFLLRHWDRHGEESALAMVTRTLEGMWRGGIHDHLGHGFHRYSTDDRWRLPHFEKMLYDQALLARAYLEAFQVTGRGDFSATARETLDYVLRDLTGPEGAFYCGEDADSEGEEGRFYLWTEAEILEALGPEEGALFNRAYQVGRAGNFRDEATGRRTGANVLHLLGSLADTARRLELPEEELARRLETSRQILLARRGERPRPRRDDKILTDWNGLMIGTLARAAQAMGEPAWAEAAARAAAFLRERSSAPEGGLMHRWRDGEAAGPGFLDDYAFLVEGLLDLHEATCHLPWLEWARALQVVALQRFWDERRGGFFLTPAGGEELLFRPRDHQDGARPAGGSVATLNLIRLGRITGDPALLDLARRALHSPAHLVRQAPMAFTGFLMAYQCWLGPAEEIVVAGPAGSPEAAALLAAARRRFLPHRTLLFRPTESMEPPVLALAPHLAPLGEVGGRPAAHVRRGGAWLEPATGTAALEALLPTRVQPPAPCPE